MYKLILAVLAASVASLAACYLDPEQCRQSLLGPHKSCAGDPYRLSWTSFEGVGK